MPRARRVAYFTPFAAAAVVVLALLQPSSNRESDTANALVHGVPLAELVDGADSRGSERAKVTIVTFLDYECEFCLRHERTVVPELTRRYGDDVRFVVRLVPREDFYLGATRVAESALCAGRQGRFWEYHDLLVADDARSEASLVDRAQRLGLDLKRFAGCRSRHETADRLQADDALARRLDLPGTPASIVDRTLVVGAKPLAEFQRLIDAALRDD
jgi:protein-disulfide isomerase